MKTCLELKILPFDIKLEQHADRTFKVTYGLQVTDKLNYTDGAAVLGHSIFHALACDDRIDYRLSREK